MSSWIWSDDGTGATATVLFDNGEEEVFVASVRETEHTFATLASPEKIIYTATVTVDGDDYIDKKTIRVPGKCIYVQPDSSNDAYSALRNAINTAQTGDVIMKKFNRKSDSE